MTHTWWFLTLFGIAVFAAIPFVAAALLGAGYLFIRYLEWAEGAIERMVKR